MLLNEARKLRFKIRVLNEQKAESEEKHASELESMIADKDSQNQINEELNSILKAKSEEVEKLKAAQAKSDLLIKGLKYKFNEMKSKSESANEYNGDLKTQLLQAKTKIDTNIAELKDSKKAEVSLKKIKNLTIKLKYCSKMQRRLRMRLLKLCKIRNVF